jgi:hypothetical protein
LQDPPFVGRSVAFLPKTNGQMAGSMTESLEMDRFGICGIAEMSSILVA